VHDFLSMRINDLFFYSSFCVVLHAAGMRCFSDLAFVNQAELRGMKFNAEDFARLWKLLQALQRDTSRRTKLPSVAINKSLTSSAPGAFEIPYRPLDFKMEQITPSIFKGCELKVVILRETKKSLS